MRPLTTDEQCYLTLALMVIGGLAFGLLGFFGGAWVALAIVVVYESRPGHRR